jgi:hypothetical protein
MLLRRLENTGHSEQVLWENCKVLSRVKILIVADFWLIANFANNSPPSLHLAWRLFLEMVSGT